MTFADLLTELATRGALPLSRMKDCRTSLRYLAAALGYPTPEQCPLDGACRDPATWTAALETHFGTLAAQGKVPSAATRRNTRNNCRVIFRLAEAHGLLTEPLPPRLLTKPQRNVFERQQWATAPYRTTYSNQGRRRYALPQAQWPPDIAQGWRDYQARCGLRLRETTFKTYATALTLYLGYIANIQGGTPTWDGIFDVVQLKAFVLWHGKRVGRPVSSQGRLMAAHIAAMANELKHQASRALADFRSGLKAPAPLHIKRNHMVTLAEIEKVAEACLAEGRTPFLVDRRRRNPGVKRALCFQRGLMLKLLVRVPLRQRNVREMQLDRHLWKDPATGHWQLAFAGDDLKIGHRGPQVNTYELNLSTYRPEFLPILEEFLREYRPRLPNATNSPLLFLTRHGGPYTADSLHAELSCAVAMYTGKRFYPHLIRTIWATEHLTATQDFTTAATMLGDTLEVVMKTYYDIIHKDHHAKASAFLSTALQG